MRSHDDKALWKATDSWLQLLFPFFLVELLGSIKWNQNKSMPLRVKKSKPTNRDGSQCNPPSEMTSAKGESERAREREREEDRAREREGETDPWEEDCLWGGWHHRAWSGRWPHVDKTMLEREGRRLRQRVSAKGTIIKIINGHHKNDKYTCRVFPPAKKEPYTLVRYMMNGETGPLGGDVICLKLGWSYFRLEVCSLPMRKHTTRLSNKHLVKYSF